MSNHQATQQQGPDLKVGNTVLSVTVRRGSNGMDVRIQLSATCREDLVRAVANANVELLLLITNVAKEQNDSVLLGDVIARVRDLMDAATKADDGSKDSPNAGTKAN
jgi:hypothetical protein